MSRKLNIIIVSMVLCLYYEINASFVFELLVVLTKQMIITVNAMDLSVKMGFENQFTFNNANHR